MDVTPFKFKKGETLADFPLKYTSMVQSSD